MTKREQFDRTQIEAVVTAGTLIVKDNTRIPVGYKRVYTVISAMSADRAPTRMRFGLNYNGRNHFYEEEPNPVLGVYYTTAREYHTKMTRLGVVVFHGMVAADVIVINWHGYDQKIEEA